MYHAKFAVLHAYEKILSITYKIKLIYDANNQIKFWRIDFYGQVPDYEKYRMSIRIFTEENIKSGMAEVINLSFEEIDREWKIVYMDPYV